MQEGLPGSLPPQHSARDSHHSEVSSSTLLASDTCRCETSSHTRGQAGDRSARSVRLSHSCCSAWCSPFHGLVPGESSAFLCPHDCQHLARNFLVPITLEGPIRWGQAEVRERDSPGLQCLPALPRSPESTIVLRFSHGWCCPWASHLPCKTRTRPGKGLPRGIAEKATAERAGASSPGAQPPISGWQGRAVHSGAVPWSAPS